MTANNPAADNPYTRLSTEVQDALAELNADDTHYEPQNPNELIKLENSVQIFFVAIDGKVSTFSAPETLRVFQFYQETDDCIYTFLQVGEWTHALLSGASPCLQAENGAIMFLRFTLTCLIAVINEYSEIRIYSNIFPRIYSYSEIFGSIYISE